MSKYKRDDQKFRAQISALAAARLKFPSAPGKLHADAVEFMCDSLKAEKVTFVGDNCSLHRERPCNECGQPANVGGVPAYVRVIEPTQRQKELSASIVTKKFNASGLIIGLIYGAIVGAIVGIVVGGAIVLIGGAH